MKSKSILLFFIVLEITLRQNKVRCVPMHKVINPENGTEYYWLMDGHFTHQGYGLMAQILTDSLTVR